MLGSGGRPLYVELCGLPAVGKSTLARNLVRRLPDRRAFLRDKRGESLTALVRAGLSDDRRRLRAFCELFGYLRFRRSAAAWGAMRRARYIVGTALRRDYRDGSDGMLLLDEGPVTYLINVGGYGPDWEDWAELLVPDRATVDACYVFLDADPDALAERAVLRARPHKLRLGRTGKEQTSLEGRRVGHRFWASRLADAGARCLWLETAERSADEVADEVARFITRDPGPARPPQRR
jgi:hypothetical protein